jgi:hypothetical protein
MPGAIGLDQVNMRLVLKTSELHCVPKAVQRAN